MGNRVQLSQSSSTREEEEMEEEEEISEENPAISRSTIHVLLNRGQPSSLSIHHDSSSLIDIPELLPSDEEEEGGGSEGNDSDEDNLFTLQLIARLLGGNLRRRYVYCN